VSAGQSYVVSYHAPNGHYAYDHNALASAISNGPLTAPADAVGASNGIFDCCGDAIHFPTQTYMSSAYYVDVVFEPLSLVGMTATASNVVDSNPAGEAEAFQYTASTSGTSATINFYVDSSSTATAGNLGIYDDSGDGDPSSLLGQTTFTPHSGWNTVTLSGVSLTAGNTYWLAELGTSGTLKFLDVGPHNDPYSETTGTDLTSLPSTWSDGYRWDSGDASFYVAD
jgi:hypothetical protein